MNNDEMNERHEDPSKKKFWQVLRHAAERTSQWCKRVWISWWFKTARAVVTVWVWSGRLLE